MDVGAIYDHFSEIIARIPPEYITNPYNDDVVALPSGIKMVAGASRCAIVDEAYNWIVKFDIDEHEYCERECELYQCARNLGIECCFPECAYIGSVDVDGMCIALYAFQKAKCQYMGRDVSREESLRLTPYKGSPLKERCSSVAADLLRDWGEEVFARLNQFCIKFKINDLHSNNVGYIAGKLIIIDFAGYHDSYYDDEEEL